MKVRSCFINLIFYNRVTYLEDEVKAVDIVYLDFSKAFDTAFNSILLEKLAAHGLGRCTLPGQNLAGWPGPDSGGEWSSIQLAVYASGVPQGVSVWSGPDFYFS